MVYRNAINAFAECFTFEHGFLEHIMKGLYQCYSRWIEKRKKGCMNALSWEGTELGAVREVYNVYVVAVLFLSTVYMHVNSLPTYDCLPSWPSISQ